MKSNIRFDEAPRDWAVCLQEGCPMAGTCQRYLFGTLMPRETTTHNVVLPTARQGDKCKHYVETRTYPMAWGMKFLFGSVKPYERTPIRQKVMKLFGSRMQFYRYRRGYGPIQPDMQEQIARIFQQFGYTRPPRFDRIVEQLRFPN